LFEIEQELLAPEAAAIPAHLAVLVDHAMTGNDDGDAILAVGPADRADCTRMGDRMSQPLVRLSFSIRNIEQSLPD